MKNVTSFLGEFEQRAFQEFDRRRFAVETAAPFLISLLDEILNGRPKRLVHFVSGVGNRIFAQKRSPRQHLHRANDSTHYVKRGGTSDIDRSASISEQTMRGRREVEHTSPRPSTRRYSENNPYVIAKR